MRREGVLGGHLRQRLTRQAANRAPRTPTGGRFAGNRINIHAGRQTASGAAAGASTSVRRTAASIGREGRATPVKNGARTAWPLPAPGVSFPGTGQCRRKAGRAKADVQRLQCAGHAARREACGARFRASARKWLSACDSRNIAKSGVSAAWWSQQPSGKKTGSQGLSPCGAQGAACPSKAERRRQSRQRGAGRRRSRRASTGPGNPARRGGTIGFGPHEMRYRYTIVVLVGF